jgi:hypothetical protein
MTCRDQFYQFLLGSIAGIEIKISPKIALSSSVLAIPFPMRVINPRRR